MSIEALEEKYRAAVSLFNDITISRHMIKLLKENPTAYGKLVFAAVSAFISCETEVDAIRKILDTFPDEILDEDAVSDVVDNLCGKVDGTPDLDTVIKDDSNGKIEEQGGIGPNDKLSDLFKKL